MRSRDECRRQRTPSRRLAIGLGLALVLGGCASAGGSDGPAVSAAAALQRNGPEADYPVLIGEPFTIAGQVFRPADTLNYDEVGYLTLDHDAAGVTGAHHTLPVPSYAEVTSLANGRTILVRLERRGPMDSTHLVALSPAAAALLDAAAETPVRVRRVNPPELQRALLRSGEAAPARMDTPISLVSVLRRRLPPPPAPAVASSAEAAGDAGDAAATAGTPPPLAEPAAPVAPSAPPPADLAPLALPSASAAPAQAAAAPSAGFVVQAGAFSSEANARRVAEALGASISRAGGLYRVRTGPFATRAQAEASLANVRAAGYSEARILTGG